MSALPEASSARPAECLLLRQAWRYIDLHLDEPELSAADLCRTFHVSRAKLYRLSERDLMKRRPMPKGAIA